MGARARELRDQPHGRTPLAVLTKTQRPCHLLGMDRLPPLNPLRAFEAAGRLKSIRKAAAEMLVTPGAVSRQVHVLEVHLGVKLFRRLPRSIALTAAGEQYLEEVSRCFAGIQAATQKVTGRGGRKTLNVRAYTTFAMKWLIPRLSSFHALHPDIEVRLTTSLEAVNFELEGVDCAFRLGDGAWPGFGVDRLVRNELIPVCSPQLLAKGALHEPSDLARHTLLHSLARPDDWKHWLAAAGAGGVNAYGGQKYESSVLSNQAAIEGQGVSIAQRVMVESDLAEGRLVAPFALMLDMGAYTYYLIYPRDRLRGAPFRKFREWVVAKAGETHDVPPLHTRPEARQHVQAAMACAAPGPASVM